MKIHPSNYWVDGFVEETSVAELATLDRPVAADIGSGLLDANVPWLRGAPPAWLAGEPAAAQAIADGADIVTFSADKLLGGPQAGIIVGAADLVQRCAKHPLARALRCGGLVLNALQSVALSYLAKSAATDIAFWRMIDQPVSILRDPAERVVAEAGLGSVIDTVALPGAGSAPGVTMPSVGISVPGDRLTELRGHGTPVVARTRDGRTLLDLRSVDPADDVVLVAALSTLGP